jgi:hypothetical protein
MHIESAVEQTHCTGTNRVIGEMQRLSTSGKRER